jgi:hypothetical protein
VVKWVQESVFGVEFVELSEPDALTLRRLLCLLPT